jgi:FkbM family methyltransferase
MSFKSFINSTTSIFGFKLARTTPSAGNPLASFGIPKNEFDIKGQNIFFKPFNVTIPKQNSIALLQGYENAYKLLKQKNAIFTVTETNELHVKVDGTNFCINDEEEFFILTEVFLEGSYNLKIPLTKKIALIDIGMNVGVTSLFYASNPAVEKVFSFEPFEPTYKMALNNIALNPSVAHKIQAFNFGLAAKETTLQVPYSLQQKGRMVVNGTPQSTMQINKASQQTIQLKPVQHQFQTIGTQTQNNFVVCKIDCEGAEYEIIDSLFEAGLLNIPDVYFIEWHYKSPDTIVSKLLKSNYYVVCTTFRPLHSGMIYALKK